MSYETKIDDILNQIANLSLDDQGYIVNIVNHRVHELQRDRLGDRAREAELHYNLGQFETGTADDLFAKLDND